MVFVLFIPALFFGGYKIYSNTLADLPVLGPYKLLSKGKKELSRVPHYAFTDQNNQHFANKNVEDKIVLYSFFFASCPQICPSMNRNIQAVQQVFIDDESVTMVSFSIDPERDTPERLSEYSDLFSLKRSQWHFLTGEKNEIFLLASKGFNVTATDGDGGLNDMIHSQTIMLVDPNHQIRGIYEGTESKEVPDLVRDIKRLKKEFKL